METCSPSRAARQLILASSLLVTSLIIAPRAGALPRPELYTADVVHPEIAIPANGVFSVIGSATDAPLITVAPSDDPTALIPGTTTEIKAAIHTRWTWKADAQLAPGTYTVTTQHSPIAVVSTFTITVIEPFSIELPEVTATATLGEKLTLDQFSCCSQGTGASANKPCFGETTYREARLDVTIGTTAAPELANQFIFIVYDVSHLGGPPYQQVVEPPGSASILAADRADEYCYQLHAYDLTTGEMHDYAELMPLCVLHGTFGEVGWLPLELRDGDEELLARDRCVNPPESLRTVWCEINMAACEGLSGDEADDNGCSYYDFACHDGPPPGNQVAGGAGGAMSEPPTTGGVGGESGGAAGVNGAPAAGGSGSASGAAGVTGGTAGMAMPPAAPTEMPSEAAPQNAGGCACSAARPRELSGPSMLALALLSAGSLARARTKRRLAR